LEEMDQELSTSTSTSTSYSSFEELSSINFSSPAAIVAAASISNHYLTSS